MLLVGVTEVLVGVHGFVIGLQRLCRFDIVVHRFAQLTTCASTSPPMAVRVRISMSVRPDMFMLLIYAYAFF